jgi:hypothetical protein
VQCETLAGTTLKLPGDLKGGPAVLVATFARKHSDDLKPWLDEVARAQRLVPTTRLLSTAVMGAEVPGFVRMLATQGMKFVIDDDLEPHTCPLYEDKEGFARALGQPSIESILVVVLNRSGQVVWSTRGAWSAATGGALQQAIAKLAAAKKAPRPAAN